MNRSAKNRQIGGMKKKRGFWEFETIARQGLLTRSEVDAHEKMTESVLACILMVLSCKF